MPANQPGENFQKFQKTEPPMMYPENLLAYWIPRNSSPAPISPAEWLRCCWDGCDQKTNALPLLIGRQSP